MAKNKARSAKQSRRGAKEQQTTVQESPAKKFIIDQDNTFNLAQEEAANLLLHVDGGRVFYYPACFLDWKPLRLFHSFCDVFLMCDWMHSEKEVCEAITNIRIPGYDKVEFSVGVGHIIDRITDMDNLPWDIIDREEANCKVWGQYARLKRGSELGKQTIHLVYFQGNPVTAYQNLFTAQQTAPRYICLKYLPVFPVQWQNLVSPDGPLMSAIHANPHRTQYLLRDISEPPAF